MTTRTGFIAGSAALVGFAVSGGAATRVLAADAPPAALTTLGAWIRMLPDGSVQHFTDKVEVGMGVTTGLAQLIADELDIPLADVHLVVGDTAASPSNGGVGGSFSTYMGNFPVRHVAAQMRSILVAAAAARLGAAPGDLGVRDGVAFVRSDPARRLAYRDVVAALQPDPAFPTKGAESALDVTVPAKPKEWSQYTLAGKPTPRFDAAPKAFGRYPYVVDVKLPGMLHGRMIVPPGIGQRPAAVDPASIRGIGDARVVRVRDFVGVVASREWDAIKAARQLAVTWTAPTATLPAMHDLAAMMWSAPTTRSHAIAAKGDAAGVLAAGGAIEATYAWPFQAHANMGPGCSVADVRPDGVTIWSGTQKVHALRSGIGELLGVPAETVRVRWVSDAGSYGRGGLEESAGAAALLSRAVGKPVRVQSMRSDNTQWGPKGPAMVGRLRGALKDGGIVAFTALLRQFNGNEIYSRPDNAFGFLAGQLTGAKRKEVFEFGEYSQQSGEYAIPNVAATAELIAPFAPDVSPLRTAHLRDPQGPATTFIVESFIDELAAAAQADPVAFRLRHLTNPRHLETLRAAAAAAQWETRPAGIARRTGEGGALLGRGVAFAVRGPTIVATVAEVVVQPATGVVRVKRLVCAHDCGFIVNPSALRGTIEANLVQSLSRALFEEVTFDAHAVTSRDWRTYRVARTTDLPELVVVPLHRPDVPPGGAGEPSSRPTAAAIANAVFDATGRRVRTAPLTPKNVLAALA